VELRLVENPNAPIAATVIKNIRIIRVNKNGALTRSCLCRRAQKVAFAASYCACPAEGFMTVALAGGCKRCGCEDALQAWV
jgi:hypothetical protein